MLASLTTMVKECCGTFLLIPPWLEYVGQSTRSLAVYRAEYIGGEGRGPKQEIG